MFLCDGLYFTMARIGIPNALMVFFGILALWRTVVHFWSGESKRLLAMTQVGIAFGLACATKWAAVGMAAPIATVILVAIKHNRTAAPRLLHLVQMFGVLPLAAYLMSFLVLPFLPGYSWASVFTLQYEMLIYHLNETCNHRYLSNWRGWPLLIRPIWFFFQRDAAADTNVGVICLGNPAVFLLTMCGGALALYRSIKNSSVLALLVLIGYLSNWLLWAPVSRATYFHYIYPAQIFGSIAAGLLVGELFDCKDFLRRCIAALSLLLVVVVFFYFYPLQAALPIHTDSFFQKMWRDTWI
jgi:dolichyl-phosphate-mannose--protein O-mannosyl transferase